MSTFSTPAAPGTGFTAKEHLGSLLLIDVRKAEVINTANGEAEVISGDVNVLDGPNVGEAYEDTLIFGKVLVSQLKKDLGKKVLGRLSQGQAKPGQSAPWVLNDPSDDDKAKAEAWVAENTKPTVTSAAAPF